MWKPKGISDYSISRLWLAGFNHFTSVLSIVLDAKNRAENKTSEVLVHGSPAVSDFAVCR